MAGSGVIMRRDERRRRECLMSGLGMGRRLGDETRRNARRYRTRRGDETELML